MQQPSNSKLVVDTNTFIASAIELANLASLHSVYTTPSVLAEIKDAETKKKVDLYFPAMKVSVPATTARTFVLEFAKKTGDFVSLSPTDIDIIALAYDLIDKDMKSGALRKSPMSGVNHVGGANKGAKRNQESMGWGEEGWASDDEDGWVGPHNLGTLKTETKPLDTQADSSVNLGVSVITSDFAMQNLLLQIGIPLINLEGKLITKVKSYVLECFSCWAISRKTDIVFCKKCGKNTLLKVTCEFLDDGQFILYRKKNKEIIKRGSRFPIPDPKGGRQVNDLILYEDDLLKPKVQSYLRRVEKEGQRQDRLVKESYESGLGLESVKSQSQKVKALNVGFSRNPNISKPKRR